MSSSVTEKILFFFNSMPVTFKNRRRFKLFLVKILRYEGKRSGLINVIFCKDSELKRINYQYLGHNYFTDIITFDLSEDGLYVNADIYISPKRVKENSRIFKVTFNQELHRVMIHGVLHLCGYGDKSAFQKRKMSEKEDKYLALYFKK